MEQWEALIQRLKGYDPTFNEVLLNRAFLFSKKAHSQQVRASGEPYFLHPLKVAQILVDDLHLDCQSVVTALLHDTVEDTLATLEEIDSLFGPEIMQLVDGVTKLSRFGLQSEEERQAENFRKLVLATSSDIRVLLIKLADRLHNMRTLHYVGDDIKCRRIARETMDIYVPLAERMGIQPIKVELEDLAFSVLNSEARKSILARLNYLHEMTGNTVEEIIQQLSYDTKGGNIDAQITGREKTPYSIWRKMQLKNVTFEQLSDIMAFRIVVKNVAECYHTLGILHSRYAVVPGRFKDYISTPKLNGYRSLHTSIMGPRNQRIEVQIRTKEMHYESDLGVAMHWQYKQGPSRDGRHYTWLRGLLEILEQASGPEEFLANTKCEMFPDQVFCFTPKGKVIALPKGSSPIDFAYAVHSEIGNHAVATKINGRQMPLRTILQNGDQVEILTAKNQVPSPSWERFALTGKARSNIRKFLRGQYREQYAAKGQTALMKALAREKLDFDEKAFEIACTHFQAASLEDLYSNIGAEIHTAKEVIAIAYPHRTHRVFEKKAKTKIGTFETPKKENYKGSLAITGLIQGMAVQLAKCCHPLPGEPIVGVVITGKGVTMHAKDCKKVVDFQEPERLLDVAWNDTKSLEQTHIGRLRIIILNQSGSLTSVTAAIAKSGCNIVSMKSTRRTQDFGELSVDVEVTDLDHLNQVITLLRSVPLVNRVERS